MGIYLNPRGTTKERFLHENAIPIPGDVKFEDVDGFIICLVNNGLFTAAAVAWSPSELEEFRQPDDMRPKLWYAIEKDKAQVAMTPIDITFLKDRGSIIS